MRHLVFGLLLVGGCGDNGTAPDGGGAKDLAGAKDFAMSGQDLATSGGDMSTTGADMATTGGDMATTGGDMTTTGGDMTALCCGQPGDVGNNLGVGKYCADLTGCGNNGMATICSTLGDPMLHFCTFLCQMGDNCGTGASCQCNNQGQCACFPDSCANMPATC
jgi:hypothetical protein